MLVPGALGTAIQSGRFMLLSLLARRKGCGCGSASVRELSRLWGAYFGDSTNGTGTGGGGGQRGLEGALILKEG